jgi:hypothetical protein
MDGVLGDCESEFWLMDGVLGDCEAEPEAEEAPAKELATGARDICVGCSC